MIRLTVLSGRRAGESLSLGKFPLRIGRGGGDDVLLDDPGVWETHVTLRLDAEQRVVQLECRPETTVVVDGEAVTGRRLRNGSVLGIGAARVRFGFSDVRQHGFRLREAMTWVAVGLLCLAQVAIIYWVLP